jgi:hypothetical protein
VLNEGSPALAFLYDEFSSAIDKDTLAECSNALEWMERLENPDAQSIGRQIRTRFRTDPLSIEALHAFSENDFLRDQMAIIDDEIHREERILANATIAPDSTSRLRTLHEILKAAPAVSQDRPDDEEISEDEEPEPVAADMDAAATAKILLRLIRSLALQATSGKPRGSRSILNRVEPWFAQREPNIAQLLALGRKLQLRRRIRILDNAARDLVFGVPAAYVRFRRRMANAGLHFQADAGGANRSSVLSPLEADIVILMMLTNARRAFQRRPDTAWLEPISGRRIMQLFVDEATDFSAIQLACMLSLTHPKLRSWFACGDFRQRITASGISGYSEIEWLRRVTQVPDLEIREIVSEYRQSSRLKALARALSPMAFVDKPGDDLSSGLEDPAPLLAEGVSGSVLAEWLAARIIEVERLVGRLPSIAVFVASEEAIDSIVKLTGPLLAESNLQIVGCRDGRDVGNAQEVRVFDIQHIKGLEFEAVFFIGVDLLAARMPELFQRYIYVGVTRAATFLGITCSQKLPDSLEPVRSFFSGQMWGQAPTE